MRPLTFHAQARRVLYATLFGLSAAGCGGDKASDQPPVTSDPCEEITCDQPPAPSCDGDVALSYDAAGTCDDGDCTYTETSTDCALSGERCEEGVCIDLCAGITCDEAPAPSCDGEVALSYDAAGTCDDGDCTYTETSTDCALIDARCEAGVCIDLCAGITCDEAPLPSCDGDVALTYEEAGTCEASECTYAETSTDCALSGERCEEGVCVDPCASITCDEAPLPACDGEVALSYDAAGTCDAGECTYAETSTDCALSGERCDAGVCLPYETTRIATGGFHTCALRDDFTVSCWGYNNEGQVGDGTQISRSTPTPIADLDEVIELVGGHLHTCARRKDNTVICWGVDFAQLGGGFDLTPITGLGDIIALAAGESQTCALREDNTVACLGYNGAGELGDGTTTSRSTPVLVSGLTDAVEVVAGSAHTCARRQDNTVVCWGDNWGGQLGDGTTTRRLVPTEVIGLTDAVELTAGYYHTCARRLDNSVVCWGWNPYGQLGDGTQTSRSTPSPVSGLTDVAELAAGRDHTCARRVDNSVACWGWNAFSQLGDGTTVDSAVPTAASSLGEVAELYAGADHNCALRADDTLYCWGKNVDGQLGDGTTDSHLLPILVNGL